MKKSTYDFLFHPESIAVIGASGDPLKPGGRVFKSILENGYKGVLMAVNPKGGHIRGIPALPSIEDIPGPIDLAIVVIPSSLVVSAIRSLAQKKTGAVIILTSGFGEKDAAGKELEKQILEIAQNAGMDIVGPNCSGFLTHTYKGKFAGIMPTLPGSAVDIIAGSGATVDYFMEMADRRGLSFGMALNLGNSIQYGVEDMIRLYDLNYRPSDARVLIVYMESVRKPDLLLKHTKSLSVKGCVPVVVKSGHTPAGRKAAASHTAAIANRDTAVQALFDKTGMIRVESRAALIDAACALLACRGRFFGRNICVLTDAGGPGVMAADAVFKQGFSLAVFKPATLECLRQILPPEASILNPIDCGPSRNADTISRIISVMETHESGNVDAIILLIGNSGMSDNAPIYAAVASAMKKSPIPVLPVFTSLTTAGDQIETFIQSGGVYFQDEVALMTALTAISGPGPAESKEEPLPSGYDRYAIAALLENKSGALSSADVESLLKSAGFKLPAQRFAHDPKDLATACAEVGFPMAMKVLGPLHKTDVGGVRLGIMNLETAETAFDALMAVKGAEGVVCQTLVDGLELIIGADRDEDFGHLIMFGLGGIHTEVLKDVRFGLAPLTGPEIRQMIFGIQGAAILSGTRGQEGVNDKAVSEHILRVSRLVSDFPVIREMDINPLKGRGRDLVAVDARVILQ